MLHKTSQERYGKLKKVFHRLKRNFNADDLEEFVLTANSLREWILQDPALSQEQKNHVQRFTVPQSLDWQICHEIANVQKHGKQNNHGNTPTLVKSVQVETGMGTGFAVPPTMRIVGAGDKITFKCGDREESALAFVVRTFKHFHYIFEIAPIPVGQRDVSLLDNIF
jgi:hypothetical protein